MTVSVRTSNAVIYFMLQLLHFTTSSSSRESICNTNPSSKECPSSSPCTIFLAPSTIPNSGFGVYTTKPILHNTTIIQPDSPTIPIIDLPLHNINQKDPRWKHKDYVWASYSPALHEGYESVSDSVMTLGSLANYHTYLFNTKPLNFGEDDDAEEDLNYDDEMLDRGKDVGAGGFSYYGGKRFIARRDIDEGEEIFSNYGSAWLEGRDGFEKVPREEDFDVAEDILGIIQDEIIEKMEKSDQKLSKKFFPTIRKIVSSFNERSSSLLPESYSDFKTLDKTRSSSSSSDDKDTDESTTINNQLAWNSITNRTVDWIHENGLCLTNMIPQRSTIHQAGQGAFASRLLKADDMIVPATLLHITDRDTLIMHEVTLDEEKNIPQKEEKIIGSQIMMNYCFGHEQSSLLLCPNTNAILLNHCSDRRDWGGECGEGVGPNAMYRWGTDWDPQTDYWLGLDVDEMKSEKGRGLSFGIIATRDIQPGEEIFIDYGIEWEEAWDHHVTNWKPPSLSHSPEFKSWKSTKRMNAERKKYPFRTETELLSNPYPSNIITGCFYYEDEADVTYDFEYDGPPPDGTPLSEIIRIYGFDEGEDYIVHGEWRKLGDFWPCKILQRMDDNKEDNDDGMEVYIVQILNFFSKQKDITWWFKKGIPRIIKNYPHNSIRYFNKPYTSDLYLPGAFRHYIPIRDEIFPDHWKNL